MDILKLLQSAEETIYEVAAWLALLFKTLGQVIFKPQWIQSYVTAEWEKEPPQRFKDFLSPILFWVFIAVAPTFSFLDSFSTLKAWSFNNKAILAVMVLIGVPMMYAVFLQKASGRAIEKDSLKRLFYIQCLPSAIAQGALTLSTLSLAPNFTFLQMVCGQSSTITLLWFLVAETLIFKKELNSSLARGLGWSMLTLIACGLSLIGIVLIMAVVGIIPTQPPN